MALKDRIPKDIRRVFINMQHFATDHTWNGIPFQCVADEEIALKRRSSNAVDIGWDNNLADVVIYVKADEFPGRAVANEHGLLDNKPMKILNVQHEMGMYAIDLSSNVPRPL